MPVKRKAGKTRRSRTLGIRIPVISKLIAQRRIKSAGNAIDKLMTRIEKTRLVVGTAKASALNCCPDSIRLRDQVSALEARVSGACTAPETKPTEKEEVPPEVKKCISDDVVCRKNAGIVTRADAGKRKKWVGCMKSKGRDVTKFMLKPEVKEFCGRP